MAPLIVLLVGTAGLLAVGRAGWQPQLRTLPAALRGGLAAMFVLTGVSHFVGMRGELIAMVPAWVPAPELMVTVTGVAEIAGAAGLLWWRTAAPASAGLTLLLVVMFPANVHLALTGTDLPWWDALVPRTVMQLLFVAATAIVLVTSVGRGRQRSPGSSRRPAVLLAGRAQ